MKRLDFRTMVAVAALAAAASCKGDPTASLRGGVRVLSLNPDLMFVDQGATKGFEVTVRDQQLNPVPAAVTVTSTNTAVITVAPDTTTPSADSAHYNFVVTAVGPGQAKLAVSAGGITDTASVTVLPGSFNGTFSTTTPKGGDTVTIVATALLKFDTAKVTVTCACGAKATILYKSRDTLRVLAPFSTPGPWTFTGIAVTYVPGLVVTLNSSATITVTGNLWAAANSWQTAPDITGLIPAVAGQSNHMITTYSSNNFAVCPEVIWPFGSSGPCSIFKVTLAAPTALRFRVNWIGTATAPDVDLWVCSDSTRASFNPATLAPCNFEGGAGATASKPEITATGKTYAAGTWWFVIENYAGSASANLYVDVIRP